MPVDGPLGRYGDDPERRGDRRPDESPDHGRFGGHETGAPLRLAETRSRSEYYEALRAADGYPAAAEDQRDPAPDRDSPERDWPSSGWETPGLADHPDRPLLDSFRVPPERAAHILDGDATGGGHRHGTGRPGKTEFPATWDDKKIIDTVVDVARNPDRVPVHQAWNDRWQARGARSDVDIVVIVERDGTVWSGWPLEGGPGVVRNPKKGTQ